MVVMPSKIIVMLSTNATEVSSQMKILRPHYSDILSTFVLTRTYTEAFTHRRRFYTQTLLHTDAFTHRRFYTQTLVRTNALTRRRFYTQTYDFTHRPCDTFTHRRFYTQTLLHTGAFTHRRFDTFTHRRFYTQTLLHTDVRFYTQTL